MDYMMDENYCLVGYDLCGVPRGAYPFAEGQVWAEPDITQAVDHMIRLVSDRSYVRGVGEMASRHVRTRLSHRAIGLRYLERLQDTLARRDGDPKQL